MNRSHKLKGAVKRFLLRELGVNSLDAYVTSAPSAQNALDIFGGEWVSALPDELAGSRAGSTPLFADDRMKWLDERLGGVRGMRVLELGPLEAGHTYMLERAGAAEIVAVEANTRAYLKCLVVKELCGLRNARFLCGDFTEYLRACDERFDVCVASGVLYHMRDPVELIAQAARAADKLFLWTHYYDQAVAEANRELARKITAHTPAVSAGFRHTLHRYEYGSVTSLGSFCGGSAPYSCWLAREDILASLAHFGYARCEIGFDRPEHPNGPAFAVLATR